MPEVMAPEAWSFETRQIHAGTAPDPTTPARAVPIYQTGAFAFQDTAHAARLFTLEEKGNIYSRIQNPTHEALERRIASLEGAVDAVAVASGHAAVALAILNPAGAGDHVVSSAPLYGGTYNLLRHLLPEYGIETTFVDDPDDPGSWRRALRPTTKAVFGETVGNPRDNLLDIRAVADVAHAAGVPFVLDNTGLTPYLLRPAEHGVDVVVHSTSKYLSGHGTVIGGVVVDNGTFDFGAHTARFPKYCEPAPSFHGLRFWDEFGPGAYARRLRLRLLRDLGPATTPFTSFLVLQGLETLSLRMERHVSNALELAHWLEGRPEVSSVHYPGLPSSPWHGLGAEVSAARGGRSRLLRAGRRAGGGRALHRRSRTRQPPRRHRRRTQSRHPPGQYDALPTDPRAAAGGGRGAGADPVLDRHRRHRRHRGHHIRPGDRTGGSHLGPRPSDEAVRAAAVRHLVFVDSSVLGLRAMEYAREKGDSVTLLWSSRYDFMHTPASRERALDLADRAIEVTELHDPRAALRALRAAGVRPDGIDGVIATLHMLAGTAARLAELTGAQGPSLRGVAAARDKAACRRIMDEHGLPNVRYAEVTEAGAAVAAAADIGYPVVVKPVCGVGKNVTTFARSPQDVERHFQEAGARLDSLEQGFAVDLDDRYILEEVALGPLYSVEVATDGTTYTPLVTVRRKLGLGNPVLELGSTVPCGLPPAAERELGAYAVDVCRALGLDLGLFHVEVIGTADGPRLVEVNPRTAGGTVPEVIRAATGRGLFEVLVDLYDGEPLSPEPFPVETVASHTFLAAQEDCVVRDDLPADWFEAFRPRLHSGSTSIGPGSRLLGMEGNTTTYGVIRVVAEDAARAEAACTELREEISELLGFPMVPLAPGLLEARS